MKASESGGVNAISIAGRTRNERERLIGMTPEERAWRKRFLESQNLAPEEPILPKTDDAKHFNIIRRMYRAPMSLLQRSLARVVGENCAFIIRYGTAKLAMGITGIYIIYYYMKYNRQTWMSQSGWRMVGSRSAMYPGMKGYPNYEKKKPNEYATYGFEKSPI